MYPISSMILSKEGVPSNYIFPFEMKQFFMFSQRVVSLVVRHKAHLLVMKSYPLLIGDSFISHGNNRPPKINMDTQNDGPWKAGNGTLQKWRHFWYQFVRFLECKSLLSTSQLYHGKKMALRCGVNTLDVHYYKVRCGDIP